MMRLQGDGWLLRLSAALFVIVGMGLLRGGETARAQDGASVSIVDFSFNPGTVTVAAGATVTWTNNGDAPHTATADGGAFDSGTLQSGASFSFTFSTPGTYTYFCTIHPNMTGTIIVTGGDTGDDGTDDTGDDGGDTSGAGTTTMPSTGAGTTALGSGTPLLMGLAALAAALALAGLRLRLRHA